MLDVLALKPVAELGLSGVALVSALWFAFVRVPGLFRQFSDDLRADRRICQELMLAHDLKADRRHAETLSAVRDLRDACTPFPEAGHSAR
jgi:hypothetical protein